VAINVAAIHAQLAKDLRDGSARFCNVLAVFGSAFDNKP
jgi:hypothetical protein